MVLQDIRRCPTFVINLDRRKDRWLEFAAQPTLKEFDRLERFSAVEGAKLDQLNDTRIAIHTRQNIHRKQRRSHHEINTPGAIGASFSHITLWENFLKSQDEQMVVFEDDTMVTQKDLDKIDQLIPTLPEDWHFWLLGTHNWSFKGKPIIPGDEKSWQRVSDFTGAHAQVITRKGAEILLKEPFPIHTHIEQQICACAELSGLNLYRHPKLRVGYFMELSETNDSDTFDKERISCPVCQVPDDYMKTCIFLNPYHQVRLGSAVLAAGVIGQGLQLAQKKGMIKSVSPVPV